MLKKWYLFCLLISFCGIPAGVYGQGDGNTGDEQAEEQVQESRPTFLERLMFWRRDRTIDRSDRLRNPYQDYNQQELDRALWDAVAQRNNQMLRDLLMEGASSNSRNMHQRTILIEAARTGYLDGVRILIDFGASVNSRDMYGGTAFIYASRGGHHEIVYLLQRSGARTN